jgi:hypothetical protein
MNDLHQLALIGNCHVAALLDARARMVWWCVPRLDGDPFFAALLDDGRDRGSFAVELMDVVRAEQAYVPNTAILVTRLYDRADRGIEITDFAPRFRRAGWMYRRRRWSAPCGRWAARARWSASASDPCPATAAASPPSPAAATTSATSRATAARRSSGSRPTCPSPTSWTRLGRGWSGR